MDSISPSIIENYFKNHKITNAENIFLVLSRISKSKTIKVFNQINNENIITPLSHPELNFSQALETLNKIKNKVYNDVTLNCNKKINQILDEYISRYIKHSSSYYKLSLSDFFKAFYFGYKINSEIIEKHCKADFLNKLNCNTHRGYEISSLFQNTRRISEVTKGEFDKEIQMFLFLNTENFLNTIQNEEITKSLSGLAELHLSEFSVFADELLFKAKQTILQKANQLRGEVIFKVKIIPDIEKIAINKAKVILKELNNH